MLFQGSFIKVLTNINFLAIVLFRLSRQLHLINRIFNPISFLILLIVRILCNIELRYTTEIGEGFRINHGLGIVIGGKVKIGKNLTIMQGVTIGGNFGEKVEYDGKIIEQPIIKSNVYICAGAKIVRPIIIEEGVIIGANSLIIKSIYEKNIIVSGNPGLKIGKTEKYKNYLNTRY